MATTAKKGSYLQSQINMTAPGFSANVTGKKDSIMDNSSDADLGCSSRVDFESVRDFQHPKYHD